MEDRELDINGLMHFINAHEGEFFVRVTLNEEGEFCGETDERSISETGEGCSDYEYCAYH